MNNKIKKDRKGRCISTEKEKQELLEKKKKEFKEIEARRKAGLPASFY